MKYLGIGTGFYIVLFCELMKKGQNKRDEKIEIKFFFILGHVSFLMRQPKKKNVAFLMGQMKYYLVVQNKRVGRAAFYSYFHMSRSK